MKGVINKALELKGYLDIAETAMGPGSPVDKGKAIATNLVAGKLQGAVTDAVLGEEAAAGPVGWVVAGATGLCGDSAGACEQEARYDLIEHRVDRLKDGGFQGSPDQIHQLAISQLLIEQENEVLDTRAEEIWQAAGDQHDSDPDGKGSLAAVRTRDDARARAESEAIQEHRKVLEETKKQEEQKKQAEAHVQKLISGMF
jgi:hypothetical protein